MAEGLSNAAIAARPRVTDKAIGKHTQQHLHETRPGAIGRPNIAPRTTSPG
ncbi:hypothetical protein AB0I53_26330 [Saccharopolyspora sp. NPDC050389]|uniref:hypothetical protein n=1 Tax=Saccharopolyspora sp. NPDC050389 TaxID=3155516 RepID=UPI0033FB746F